MLRCHPSDGHGPTEVRNMPENKREPGSESDFKHKARERAPTTEKIRSLVNTKRETFTSMQNQSTKPNDR